MISNWIEEEKSDFMYFKLNEILNKRNTENIVYELQLPSHWSNEMYGSLFIGSVNDFPKNEKLWEFVVDDKTLKDNSLTSFFMTSLGAGTTVYPINKTFKQFINIFFGDIINEDILPAYFIKYRNKNYLYTNLVNNDNYELSDKIEKQKDTILHEGTKYVRYRKWSIGSFQKYLNDVKRGEFSNTLENYRKLIISGNNIYSLI